MVGDEQRLPEVIGDPGRRTAGDHQADDVLDRRGETVAVEEDRVPHGVRDQHRQEAGDEVADQQLAAQHDQVRHGVAGGVRPTGSGAETPRPWKALPHFRHLGVGLMPRRGGGALVEALAGQLDEPRLEEEPRQQRQQPDHDHPADVLAQRELPADQDPHHKPELDDEVGRGQHEDHRGSEVRALLEERLGHRAGGVGAG